MNEPPKPVMAINPYTNTMMNVEPLFDFIRTWYSRPAEEIEGVIRTFVASPYMKVDQIFVHNPFQDVSEMFSFLYHLKDMFMLLEECEISLPKKGSKS